MSSDAGEQIRVEGNGSSDGVEGGTRSKREIAIRARGLTKAYAVYAHPRDRLKQFFWPARTTSQREVLAVCDVDLDVYRGETVGIVGRNGSGKSTLLNLVCGTLEPTCGELSVQGHLAPMLALGAGFDPEFTGRENVVMNATVLGLSTAEIRSRMDAIVEFASIGDFFDRPVKTYSSGMYSRLAFSVAINADPDILVVDEVLAVGDEAFTRKCFARIEEIKRNGSTVLFVSHSSNLVIELCDRAVLLEGGRRLLTAHPKTVISRYQRLLYAPPDRLPSILEEIRDLDRGRMPVRSPGSSGSEGSSEEIVEPEDYGAFDPGFEPESTVEYEQRGAAIENPRILDPNGRRVNILRPGKLYTYAYEVRFLEPANFVRFGMMIKLTTGFELSGQASHSARESIEEVEAGTRAEVRFQFRAVLTPGSYFLNAGVLGFREGEESYLHRVLDALIFRVESGAPERATGWVDLSSQGDASVTLVSPGSERRSA